MKEGKQQFSRCLLFMIILLLTHQLKAQKLAMSRVSSYYTYIYKLENNHLQKYIKYDSSDSLLFFLKQPIDSIVTDSFKMEQLNKYPVGHYIYLKSNKNRIEINLKSIHSIEVSVMNNDRDLVLHIHKKGSLDPIKNASVFVGAKKILYQESTGTYVLKKTNKEGLLKITVDDELMIKDLSRDRNNPWVKRVYYKPVVHLKKSCANS